MQYDSLAKLYDALTFDVDYREIADGIESVFHSCERRPELVLELGCGTGSLTLELARRGYDMIGVDSSPEMLARARAKTAGMPGVLLLEQDMRSFELYGTVDAVVCALDSLNYVTEGLESVFRLVNNYLNPDGIFLFDVNTEYKFREVLADNTFVYETDDVYYVWDNCPEGDCVRYLLDFFVRMEDGNYRRFSEEHVQRIYSDQALVRLLHDANLAVSSRFDGYSGLPVTDVTQRLVYAVKKLQISEIKS